MSIMTKDKSFYKGFFSLFWVLVLQNVIVLSVNLADNIMLGGFSETALAGVAAVNQIQFVLQQLVVAVGEGAVVLSAQYWGQGRIEPIKNLSSIAIKAGLMIAITLFALVSFFPQQAVGIFTNNEAIIAEGVQYLNVIKYTYVIFTLTTILLATLRSVETVKIAFYISICTLIINCAINYTLIYGNFGAPRLGVVGAAIGTLTARIVEFIIVLIFIIFKDDKLKLKLADVLHLDKILLKDYTKVCIPIFITAAMWGVATALQTVILGHMTDNAIAANSVASNLFLILKVASVGASSAACVVIGKAVGNGDLHKIREYSRTLQLMFIGIGIFTCIALNVLRGPILSIYNLAPETKMLANSFLIILSITSIGTAYQMPCLTGIIRGGGDTKFQMINDFVSIWCIVLPVSFLAAFYWKLSPIWVVFLLNSDQIFKCVAAVIKVNRYKWVKKLTRE